MPRSKTPISYRERSVLAYIKKFQAERGFSPGIRDIADALGFNSTSYTLFLLDRMEQAGMIRREKNTARAIVVLETAE